MTGPPANAVEHKATKIIKRGVGLIPARPFAADALRRIACSFINWLHDCRGNAVRFTDSPFD
jgi:hypothetical protein